MRIDGRGLEEYVEKVEEEESEQDNGKKKEERGRKKDVQMYYLSICSSHMVIKILHHICVALFYII